MSASSATGEQELAGLTVPELRAMAKVRARLTLRGRHTGLTAIFYRAPIVGARTLQVHGIRGAWQMNKKELIKQLADAASQSAAAAGPND